MPSLETDTRRDTRALVCASALVLTEGNAPTEHMTYDLSTGGIRLCGLPAARVGEEARVVLHLPDGYVSASGRLLRVGLNEGGSDFAVQFLDLAAHVEDAIHDAVVKALAQSDCRSVLLLRGSGDGSAGWLQPVLPICATSRTPLEALEYLDEHAIEVAILGPDHAWQAREWSELYPELSWRTIDQAGRLHSVATTFRLSL